MMRYTIPILILLAGLTAAAKQKTPDELKAMAEKAKGGHQAQLYAELAERLVDVANQQFSQARSVEGHATVKEVLQYATLAHDISLQTRKKRKEVEIHLRETQRHLDDLRRTLAAEDRPALRQAQNELEKYRQDLLNSMFAPKKKNEKKQ